MEKRAALSFPDSMCTFSPSPHFCSTKTFNYPRSYRHLNKLPSSQSFFIYAPDQTPRPHPNSFFFDFSLFPFVIPIIYLLTRCARIMYVLRVLTFARQEFLKYFHNLKEIGEITANYIVSISLSRIFSPMKAMRK